MWSCTDRFTIGKERQTVKTVMWQRAVPIIKGKSYSMKCWISFNGIQFNNSLTLYTRNYSHIRTCNIWNLVFLRAQNLGHPLQQHVTSCSSLRLIWCVLEMQTVSLQLGEAFNFWEEAKSVKRNVSAAEVLALSITSFTLLCLYPSLPLPLGKHLTLSSTFQDSDNGVPQ